MTLRRYHAQLPLVIPAPAVQHCSSSSSRIIVATNQSENMRPPAAYCETPRIHLAQWTLYQLRLRIRRGIRRVFGTSSSSQLTVLVVSQSPHASVLVQCNRMTTSARHLYQFTPIGRMPSSHRGQGRRRCCCTTTDETILRCYILHFCRDETLAKSTASPRYQLSPLGNTCRMEQSRRHIDEMLLR